MSIIHQHCFHFETKILNGPTYTIYIQEQRLRKSTDMSTIITITEASNPEDSLSFSKAPLLHDELDEDGLLVMPDFDPALHLAFEPPTKRHTFSEYGLPKPDSCPDMCFTEPFPLFSEEGVRMLRRELLQKKVLDRHLSSWDRAPCYISAVEPVCIISFSRPFFYQLWVICQDLII